MTVDELLRKVGLADCRYDDQSEEHDYPTYVVHVPRDRLKAAQKALYAGGGAGAMAVRLRQVPPTLVGAKPGDVVRVYQATETDDDASPLGVVTSVQEVDGVTAYGCSYILMSLGSSFLSDIYPFHLSAENYGGYHTGFLKVVAPAELPAILERTVEAAYRAELVRLEARADAARRTVPELIKTLGKGVVAAATHWSLPEDVVPMGVNYTPPRVSKPRPHAAEYF